MTDKEYLSDVENARLPIEEPYRNKGKHIVPHQVWRYASFIKGSPSQHTFVPEVDNKNIEVCKVDYGGTIKPLISHYINFELSNCVKGTDKCSYQSDELIGYFGREFDDNFGQVDTWSEKISLKVSDVIVPLSYGIGDPIIDSESGILTFRNKQAIQDILSKYPTGIFLISFYKYSGEKGFFGSESGESLPFSDKGPLLKKDQETTHHATIKVRGGDGNNNYVLPPINLEFDEVKGKGYYGKELEKEFSSNRGRASTIVLEENLNDIIWEIGNIDGGLYTNNASPTRIK